MRHSNSTSVVSTQDKVFEKAEKTPFLVTGGSFLPIIGQIMRSVSFSHLPNLRDINMKKSMNNFSENALVTYSRSVGMDKRLSMKQIYSSPTFALP